MDRVSLILFILVGVGVALKGSLLIARIISRRRSILELSLRDEKGLRAVDCSCGYRVEGADEHELFDQLQIHIHQLHPEEEITDEQIGELVATNSYTVVER